jgi:hypothetical protein
MFKDHFVVCSRCKQLRISLHTWIEIELPVANLLTHGLCPRCVPILYPTLAAAVLKKMREREILKNKVPEEG